VRETAAKASSASGARLGPSTRLSNCVLRQNSENSWTAGRYASEPARHARNRRVSAASALLHERRGASLKSVGRTGALPKIFYEDVNEFCREDVAKLVPEEQHVVRHAPLAVRLDGCRLCHRGTWASIEV